MNSCPSPMYTDTEPVGYVTLAMEPQVSPVILALYRLHANMASNMAPDPKKPRLSSSTSEKSVHAKRKATKAYRLKQFQLRREAHKQWKEGQAARRIQQKELADWRELKREDRKKKRAPRVCPLDTCPKKHMKKRNGKKRPDSPSSVITHISQCSGRRSRSPIEFGSGTISN